jgi:biopolymer transport protein ExbD
MSRFKTADVEESVGCNLIPMIDIMFLLLLFFMLGADMSQRDLEEVELPKADRVQEESKTKTVGQTRTTINLHHRSTSPCAAYQSQAICRDSSHWLSAIRGKSYTGQELINRLKEEAELDPEQVEATTKNKISKRELMIRADQHVAYGDVQKVIQAAGQAGLYKVMVAAAKPEDAPKGK